MKTKRSLAVAPPSPTQCDPPPPPRVDIAKNCQGCGQNKPTTRSREIYTKDYMGPCADSFCYASCDSPSCRPVHVAVCDECAKEMSKEGTSR